MVLKATDIPGFDAGIVEEDLPDPFAWRDHLREEGFRKAVFAIITSTMGL